MKNLLKGLVMMAVCLCVGFFAAEDCFAIQAYDRYLPGGDCRSMTFELLSPEDLPSDGGIGQPTDPARKAPRREAKAETETYLPLVMIVIGFDEQPYVDTNDWYAQIFGGEHSVEKYFKDMSFGKFTFMPAKETSAFEVDGNTNTFDLVDDGIIHLTLDTKKSCGWDLYDYDQKAAMEEMNAFKEAIIKAGKYIDFKSYDSNKDGAIQTSELALGFIVAGRDAAFKGVIKSDEEYMYIWPNAFSFTGYREYDSALPEAPKVNGVKVDEYIAIAEQYEQYSELHQEHVGVLSHELAHYLGLPDMYSTGGEDSSDWRRYDVTYMSLMNYGPYGTDLEGNLCPYSLDIWSRVKLGWVKAVKCGTTTADGIMNIAGSLDADSGDTPVALRFETTNKDEYYLVENRRFTSWDEGMSKVYSYAAQEEGEDKGGGLVFWHIDDRMCKEHMADNTVCNYDHHPGVGVVVAERDDEGEYTLLGTIPLQGRPFFDKISWGDEMYLPKYGKWTVGNYDVPADRTLSFNSIVHLESESKPVMSLHVHSFDQKDMTWKSDQPVFSLLGACAICGENFEGDFTVNPEKVTPKVTLSKTTYVYNGSAKKPTVKVTNSSGKAYAAADYKVTYPSGRKAIGKYTVKVTMRHFYQGTKSASFTINPPAVKGLKLTSPKAKQLKVAWTKAKGGVNYQIYYRLKGNSNWKKVTVTGTSKLFKSLKGGKTYQVKVRAHKKVSGKNYYGAWTSVKSIKVKK